MTTSNVIAALIVFDLGIGVGLLLAVFLRFNVRRPADKHKTLFDHDSF